MLNTFAYASYATYFAALLVLWSIARQYGRPARHKSSGPPSLGGWDVVPERE